MNTRYRASHQSGFTSISITPRIGFRHIALTTVLLFLTFGGYSPAWAGDRHRTTAAKIHLTGFSIHIGPGSGVHLGIGGHRHGFRGPRGPFRNHVGPRHFHYGPQYFFGHQYRPYYAPRHFERHHKHRGHLKGWRKHRRHRH